MLILARPQAGPPAPAPASRLRCDWSEAARHRFVTRDSVPHGTNAIRRAPPPARAVLAIARGSSVPRQPATRIPDFA